MSCALEIPKANVGRFRLCFVFFILLEDQQKLSVGVFDKLIFIYILHKIHLSFLSQFLIFLSYLLCFCVLCDLSSKEKKSSTSELLSNKFVKTACADYLTLEACYKQLRMNERMNLICVESHGCLFSGEIYGLLISFFQKKLWAL